MQSGKILVLLLGLSLPIFAQAQSSLPGSNATSQVIFSVKTDLHSKFYPDCAIPSIHVLQLLDLQPAAMIDKKSFSAGDHWSETWRIDACGTINVHQIDFELIRIGNQIGLSQEVKPAGAQASLSFAGSNWILANSQNQNGVLMREFVTDGESVDAWSQLLTIVNYAGSVPLSAALSQMQKKYASDGCLSEGFRTLVQDSDQIVFSRDYQKCREPSMEINIVRLIIRNNRLVSILYSTRKIPTQAQTDAIVKNLSTLTIE